MNRTPAISNDVPIGKRIKGAEMPSTMARPCKGRRVLKTPGVETAAQERPLPQPCPAAVRPDRKTDKGRRDAFDHGQTLQGPARSQNAGSRDRRARTSASSTLPSGGPPRSENG